MRWRAAINGYWPRLVVWPPIILKLKPLPLVGNVLPHLTKNLHFSSTILTKSVSFDSVKKSSLMHSFELRNTICRLFIRLKTDPSIFLMLLKPTNKFHWNSSQLIETHADLATPVISSRQRHRDLLAQFDFSGVSALSVAQDCRTIAPRLTWSSTPQPRELQGSGTDRRCKLEESRSSYCAKSAVLALSRRHRRISWTRNDWSAFS